MSAATYPVSPAWRLLLRDLGLDEDRVLRRAGVAGDLLAREEAAIDAGELCRLLRAFDEEASDPAVAIRIAEALSFEMFDPPVFAAMCSDDLGTALERVSRYKRLCAPLALHVEAGAAATRVTIEWIAPPHEPPALLYALELTYFVRLARLGTRTGVRPREVTCPHPLEPAGAYAAYFGVPVRRAREATLVFDAADAAAPFLTANAGMWAFFEPELRRRLTELDAAAPMVERTRSALLELLPSGRVSVHAVARKLGTSARTLQRRLQDEGTAFQRVLDDTRGDLARHYLGATGMTSAEISFLLGFEDPNSFVRAFRDWTGLPPEQFRTRLRAGRGVAGAGGGEAGAVR
jgi:AraC-like DNA-binding protein